jgi:hypothetical protein
MGQTSSFPETSSDAVPDAERRPILLRAYVEPSIRDAKNSKSAQLPEWTLIFDTETTPDETQQLRFGTFQLLENGKLARKGIFYDRVDAAELEVLKAEAPKHRCALYTIHDFVHSIFLRAAFKAGALVVGFNLPFDLSRLAIEHGAARVVRPGRSKEEIAADAPLKKADRFWVGAFSFKLSPFDDQPQLRVKNQNSRSAFFSFAQPNLQEAAGSHRKKGRKPEFERGSFLDVKTLAAALTSTSHSLNSLAKYLGVQHKGDFKDFERVIDPEFVEYAVNDTEVTKQCFVELVRRYSAHGLKYTTAHRIHSEASLGKAYLRQMGVRPWREVQPDFDPETIGAIMSSYFGGRAEIHVRRNIVQTIYCDFASMYPAVCTLMGLWNFVIAQGTEKIIATEETREFLDKIELADLQKPDTWKSLTTLVLVKPDKDIFPVRTRYAAKVGRSKASDMPTIGVNYLSSDMELWFTLADCVASKVLTGRAPKIVRAYKFSPKPPQKALKPVAVAGKPEFRVDPAADDFYKRVIELRRQVKTRYEESKKRNATSLETNNLGMEQLALKILANATSYGIFIELNVEDSDGENKPFALHTSQGKREVRHTKREQPGEFYHPLLGTLITAAARLMLALTERLAIGSGLSWAFCDTDSMAFANIANLPFHEFSRRAFTICDWFKPLNPYEDKDSSILEIEEENNSLESETELEPLYCFAISAKRYALFNLDAKGQPIIRKASAHGLGHYVAPYGSEDEDRAERKTGVRLWEEDVWRTIIVSAVDGRPDQVDYSYRAEMNEPARSQYTASRPALLEWFKNFNEGRVYSEQVKPFNFMLSFYGKHEEDLTTKGEALFSTEKLGGLRPVAPYSRQIEKALARVFDRNGDPTKTVPREWLRTTGNVLRDYHRQPEYKFLGGGWNDSGVLCRRHVFADGIDDIGKESEGWEEDDAHTEEQGSVICYPSSLADREHMIELIKSVPKGELQREAKIARRTIETLHKGQTVREGYLKRLASIAKRIMDRKEKRELERATVWEWLKQQHTEVGLAALALLLEEDKANLSKVILGRRKVSNSLLTKILGKQFLS